MRLLRLALHRLSISIPVLLIILSGVFLVLQFAPGDAVDSLLGQLGTADEELAIQLREKYGLSGGVGARLLIYLWNLLQLDLGFSISYNKPVLDVILSRLPATMALVLSALTLAFFAGAVVGVAAAQSFGRWQDTLISLLGLIFYAAPSFWLGLMGILVFSVWLGWLPSGGIQNLSTNLSGFPLFLDMARHLIMPTVTLATIYFAIYLRVIRASMLEVLSLDFVRTARAKGLRESAVIYRHVLRNALLPMITIIGLQAGAMLGGSVAIESVFSLPGVGRLAYEAVVQRDLNMLLGIVFMSSMLVIFINFLVDMLYAQIDPRIEAGA